eukprot:TRINITY_DN3739_c0_g1_i1.p1 TRINITY_DN3739_c0_g1~~TRINITY_DN3739_c0_g1_i1.p1  ORF type:complete len:458 (+),score=54.60 TRINITY_DN3739_c0_g1_i1:62-1375(+)
MKETSGKKKRRQKRPSCNSCETALVPGSFFCHICGHKRKQAVPIENLVTSCEAIEYTEREIILEKLKCNNINTANQIWGWAKHDIAKAASSKHAEILVEKLKEMKTAGHRPIEMVGSNTMIKILQFLDQTDRSRGDAIRALRATSSSMARLMTHVPASLTVALKQKTPLTNSQLEHVTTVFHTSAAYHTLEIRNALTDTCFVKFASSLVSTQNALTRLYLPNCGLTEKCETALSEILSDSSIYLSVLNINENRICTEGGKGILKAVASHKHLTGLHMSCNRLGDNGAQYVSSTLRSNKKLKILNISYNGITKIGAREIGNGLAENSSLEALQMSGNCIKADGYRSLLEGIETGNALSSLYVNGCGISLTGEGSYGDRKFSVPSLKMLQISENGAVPTVLESEECCKPCGIDCGSIPTWMSKDIELQAQLDTAMTQLY